MKSNVHVDVIPDGNRRWAKNKRLLPWLGHQQGIKTTEKIFKKAKDLKIPYFTFWGVSYDNLTKRPETEIKFLFKAYAEQIKRILEDEMTYKDKVRVRVLGRWKEIFPQKTKDLIEKTVQATKKHNQFFLTLLLAYNGTDEMLSCARGIIGLAKEKVLEFTPQVIKENLWTKDLPPVDLVVRTGCEGDPHLSAGFMMWHTAYSQLYFTKTLYPAFTPQEFEKAINNHLSAERRFGA